MKRTVRMLVMVVVCLAAVGLLGPAQAIAAPEGDGHASKETVGLIPTIKQGVPAGIAALVVFGAVFFVLSGAVWPKILGGLKDREDKIREEIASAEAARKQAKDALEMYERSLSEARAEAQQMLENTKAEQQKLAAELRAKADAELAGMREKAMRDIESAKRSALNEIYAETATLATAAASKILQRELNPDDQRQLVDEALGQMASASQN